MEIIQKEQNRIVLVTARGRTEARLTPELKKVIKDIRSHLKFACDSRNTAVFRGFKAHQKN